MKFFWGAAGVVGSRYATWKSLCVGLRPRVPVLVQTAPTTVCVLAGPLHVLKGSCSQPFRSCRVSQIVGGDLTVTSIYSRVEKSHNL